MRFFVLGSNIDFWETIYNSQTTVLQLEPCVG